MMPVLLISLQMYVCCVYLGYLTKVFRGGSQWGRNRAAIIPTKVEWNTTDVSVGLIKRVVRSRAGW